MMVNIIDTLRQTSAKIRKEEGFYAAQRTVLIARETHSNALHNTTYVVSENDDGVAPAESALSKYNKAVQDYEATKGRVEAKITKATAELFVKMNGELIERYLAQEANNANMSFAHISKQIDDNAESTDMLPGHALIKAAGQFLLHSPGFTSPESAKEMQAFASAFWDEVVQFHRQSLNSTECIQKTSPFRLQDTTQATALKKPGENSDNQANAMPTSPLHDLKKDLLDYATKISIRYIQYVRDAYRVGFGITAMIIGIWMILSIATASAGLIGAVVFTPFISIPLAIAYFELSTLYFRHYPLPVTEKSKPVNDKPSIFQNARTVVKQAASGFVNGMKKMDRYGMFSSKGRYQRVPVVIVDKESDDKLLDFTATGDDSDDNLLSY